MVKSPIFFKFRTVVTKSERRFRDEMNQFQVESRQLCEEVGLASNIVRILLEEAQRRVNKPEVLFDRRMNIMLADLQKQQSKSSSADQIEALRRDFETKTAELEALKNREKENWSLFLELRKNNHDLHEKVVSQFMREKELIENLVRELEENREGSSKPETRKIVWSAIEALKELYENRRNLRDEHLNRRDSLAGQRFEWKKQFNELAFSEEEVDAEFASVMTIFSKRVAMLRDPFLLKMCSSLESYLGKANVRRFQSNSSQRIPHGPDGRVKIFAEQTRIETSPFPNLMIFTTFLGLRATGRMISKSRRVLIRVDRLRNFGENLKIFENVDQFATAPIKIHHQDPSPEAISTEILYFAEISASRSIRSKKPDHEDDYENEEFEELLGRFRNVNQDHLNLKTRLGDMMKLRKTVILDEIEAHVANLMAIKRELDFSLGSFQVDDSIWLSLNSVARALEEIANKGETMQKIEKEFS
ncbi:unnamed protein product [Caenorhabditis auriculariae]|uniref:Uncharacterized protein n=1 Tax=Caenorhabditis auriculariae TaxID=2777116 RepID=A0A8S1HR07_9PELO|nr:unnamed protein product [Caenorhabditis auriculariae]